MCFEGPIRHRCLFVHGNIFRKITITWNQILMTLLYMFISIVDKNSANDVTALSMFYIIQFRPKNVKANT